MEWFLPLLPVTVIAALSLFLVKELLEGGRRWQGNNRKRRAFRTLLAREIELNHWTHSRLMEVLSGIQKDFEKKRDVSYEIEQREPDYIGFRREIKDVTWGAGPLPKVCTAVMSQVMLDVAVLDKALFVDLEAAFDSMNQMKHIRNSLIGFIETDDEQHKAHLEAFPVYGLGQLSQIRTDLDKLYRNCTGKELKNFRLR